MQRADRLLPGEDPEVSQVIEEVFTAEGIDVRTGTSPDTVAPAACSNPTGPTTTSATSEAEPDRLIGDLASAGIEAEQIETFASDPIGGEGLLLCVGAEEVRVYLFGTNEEAGAAAARIDPDDPSNLGNAIVEWAGTPRFWRRGDARPISRREPSN